MKSYATSFTTRKCACEIKLHETALSIPRLAKGQKSITTLCEVHLLLQRPPARAHVQSRTHMLFDPTIPLAGIHLADPPAGL